MQEVELLNDRQEGLAGHVADKIIRLQSKEKKSKEALVLAQKKHFVTMSK